MFFDGWSDLLRVLVVGVCAYGGLVLILRVTGKRTLSKMNAFDFVVTVALGSTLASAVLSSDVSISEALLAFALLCGLQLAITFASVRSRRVQHFVKSEPALLVHRGVLLRDALRRERVTEDEVLAAVRATGKPALASAFAVVLETDGSFSVLDAPDSGSADTLRHVNGVSPRVGTGDGGERDRPNMSTRGGAG